MSLENYSQCPKCGALVKGAFPNNCPTCSFNINGLIGKGTTSFQEMNWQKHTDILFGRNIQLAKGQTYNASFDFNGYEKLEDIVRYTITYGVRTDIESRHKKSNIIISYIPEIIGAGTAIHFRNTVPCSGICLISPESENFSHSFPVIDEWVQVKFSNQSSFCRFCNKTTEFGQPICSNCYKEFGSNWKFLI